MTFLYEQVVGSLGVGMAAGESALKKTKTAASLPSGQVSGTVTTLE